MAYALPNFSTDLSGQVALVTGASAGLGWRFAKVLAAAGAHVAVTARRTDKLDTLVAEIVAAGGKAQAFKLDVSVSDELKAIVDTVEAAMGTVSILVNNAGIPDAQRAVKMSVELIDHVIDVNMRAPFILSCEVARRLIAQENAHFYVCGDATGMAPAVEAELLRLMREQGGLTEDEAGARLGDMAAGGRYQRDVWFG